MQRIFLIFLFFVVQIIPAVAQDATLLVQKVRDKLARVKDYRAEAVMTTDIPFLKIPSSSVTVYFKDPDKFRILQKNGISITPKGGMEVNVSSLVDPGKSTVLDAGVSVIQNITHRVIKILPQEENSKTVISTLYIDPKELLVRKVVTTTKDNGTFELEMKYARYSAWGLPDAVTFLFSTKDYQLPKGIAFDYDSKADNKKRPAGATITGAIRLDYTSYKINKGVADSVFKK